MIDGRPIHLKIIPELRAEHVDLSPRLYPCDVFYFRKKYDLRTTAVPPRFMKKSWCGAARALLISNAAVLEVPEPLWVRMLPRTLTLITVWRLGGIFAGSRRRVVSYALENNDVTLLLGGGRKVPSWAATLVARVLGLVVTFAYDRIVFGSDGAREVYGKLKLGRRVHQTTILELPQPAEATSRSGEPEPSGFVFVGRLEERKGVPHLMRAWEVVEATIPHVTLTIVGDGPLTNDVTAWAEGCPTRRTIAGWVDHPDVDEVVGRHAILVAPSVPEGRWREQIGLPISEGLAQGLTIVTTDQTGLAAWLQSHGHVVVPVDSIDTNLAPALMSALAHPLSRDAVTASLNSVGGRQRSDAWLHRDFGKRGEAL